MNIQYIFNLNIFNSAETIFGDSNIYPWLSYLINTIYTIYTLQRNYFHMQHKTTFMIYIYK